LRALVLGGRTSPLPAGKFLQSFSAVSTESACGLVGALLRNPCPKSIAINGAVSLRDSGMSFNFGVFNESTEALFPAVRVRIPNPAGQLLEAALPVGVESAVVVASTLSHDP
jgi:hypothetical protein